MITRVYRGCDAPELVSYLYGPGRFNEHTNQHLVACWEAGNESQLEPVSFAPDALSAAELRSHGRRIGKILDLPVAACDVEPDHVYHLVLRNDASDRILTDQEWAAIARDAMDRTGIAPAGDPMGCRWVLIRHADDHVHLAATLARQDGVRPRRFADFLKLRQVARDWEERLGLTPSAPADRTAAVNPTIGETKKAERNAAQRRTRPSGRAGERAGEGDRASDTAFRAAGAGPARRGGRGPVETPRQQLTRLVHAAASQSRDLPSLRALLDQWGVQVFVRDSQVRPGEVTGLSFGLHGHADRDGNLIRYGGGRLAPDLSWPKLTARWTQATGDGDGPAAYDPRATAASPQDRAAVWQEAERIVRDAADRIRRDGLGDPDSVGEELWAAADVLRCLATAVEGKTPGPLHQAADHLARAGRHAHRRTPARTQGGSTLRRAGLLMAYLAATNTHRDHKRELQLQAMILALASLARAVAAARRNQGRLHQARAALTAAEQLTGTATLSSAQAAWAGFVRPVLVPNTSPARGGGPDPAPQTRTTSTGRQPPPPSGR